MKIVVDSNRIIAALLKDSTTREIFLIKSLSLLRLRISSAKLININTT